MPQATGRVLGLVEGLFQDQKIVGQTHLHHPVVDLALGQVGQPHAGVQHDALKAFALVVREGFGNGQGSQALSQGAGVQEALVLEFLRDAGGLGKMIDGGLVIPGCQGHHARLHPGEEGRTSDALVREKPLRDVKLTPLEVVHRDMGLFGIRPAAG